MLGLPGLPAMISGGVMGKFWRIYTTVSNSTVNQIIGEIQFRAVVGGPNVAVGGTATADASTIGNFPARAFDGDTGTWWAHGTPVVPNWIKYEFASPVEIKQIALQAGTATANPERMPRDFEVQFSEDNVTWTTVLAVVGQTGWTSGEIRVFDL